MTVDRVLERGLTVDQLIEALQDMDGQAIPLFVCDYGDYSHTQQAFPITKVEELDRLSVVETAYSQSGIAVRELTDSDEDTSIHPNVIILHR